MVSSVNTESGSIEPHGGLGGRDDSMGFTSLLLSDLGEVLDEVALGDLIEDSDNGCVLAHGSDSIVAGSTDILDIITLCIVNSVELCNVNLSTADISKELCLSSFVGIVNLNINLLLGLVIDSIESLLLSDSVVKFEAAVAALHALNERSKTETGALGFFININSAFGMGILGASLLVSDEVIDHFLEAIDLVESRGGLELGDAFKEIL